MSQHPGSNYPQYSAGDQTIRPPAPPPTMVYAAPPKQPGFIRSTLGGIARAVITFIVSILVIWVLIAALMAGLGVMPGHLIPSIYRQGAGPARVTILELTGVIDGDSAEYVRNAVNTILETPSIAAVVFRVDSPGGGVAASDQIWYQIGRLKNNGRTVVASYGGVAASGGYYVSCHSDAIFAEETTITGSIGVLMQAFAAEELLRDIGIQPIVQVATQSPAKDDGNTFVRNWTEEDFAAIQPILDQSYEVFFERVYDGRKSVISDEQALRAIADGAIYTAPQALTNGLIDHIGYLDDAIDYAIQQVGLPADVTVDRMQKWETWAPPFWMNAFFSGRTNSGARRSATSIAGMTPEQARLWLHEATRPMVMYLMDR